MYSKITKWLAIVFLSTLILLCTLVLLIPTKLGVSLSLSIAQHYLDLEYTGLEGSLYKQLGLERLTISTDAAQIELQNSKIDLSLRCLLDLQACLESLEAESLSVVLMPSLEEEKKELSRVYLNVPLRAALNDLFIQEIHIYEISNAGKTRSFLSLLELRLEGVEIEGSELNIEQLALGKLQSYSYTQPKDNGIDKDWLEKLAATLKKPPQIVIPEIFVPLNLTLNEARLGQISTINVEKDITQTILSKLSADAELVEQVLELQAEFLLNQSLENTKFNLHATSDLSAGFEHDIKLTLDRAQEKLEIRSKGDINDIKLVIRANQQEQIGINAQLQLKENDLPITASIAIAQSTDLLNFFTVNSPIDISNATIDLAGDWFTGYSLSLDSMLTQKALADIQQNSKLHGNILISPSDFSAESKNLKLEGDLGLVDFSGKSVYREKSLHNNYRVDIANLNLSAFDARLPDKLSGKLVFDNVLSQDSMTLYLQCQNISGMHKVEIASITVNEALTVRCGLNLDKSGLLKVEELAFNYGRDEINLKGQAKLPSSALWQLNKEDYSKITVDSSFNMSIASLDSYHNDAAGRLSAQGVIGGDALKPNIDINLQAEALKFKQDQINTASLRAKIDSKQNYKSSISLLSQALSLQGQNITNLVLKLDGDMAAHELEILAENDEFQSEQSFEGGINSIETPHWKGEWRSSTFEHEALSLNLDQSSELELNFVDMRYSLAPACWLDADDNAKLCFSTLLFENEVAQLDASLSYNIAQLLHYFLPELVMASSELMLESKLNGNYSLKGGADLLLSNVLQGRLDTQEHKLDLTAIVANLRLQNDLINAVVFAGTQSTGTLGIQSSVALSPENRKHTGNLGINKFDLSLLQRFLPVINTLTGDIDANISFSGYLLRPELEGTLSVDNGKLILDAYTYALTDFSQRIDFQGRSADIKGAFKLGNGPAQYEAFVDFDDAISARGKINGERLQFAYKQHQSDISPALNFDFTPDQFKLDGALTIENTLVKIDELPESARSPSPDVIVIGKKVADPIVPIGLDLNVNVLVDPEEKGFVTVDALDLKAALSGDLMLRVIQRQSANDESFQPMQTYLNGYLNVLSGSYDAWGQNLQIQKGSIHFNGAPSLPQFDVSAIRNPLNTQGDVVAGVRVTGNPVIPKVELFSDPPMSQARQLSYLLQGTDLDGGESGDINSSLISALVGFGVGKSENRISQFGRSLGFESLNIQTAGQGDGTQVQLTGRISERLQITYGVGVFDAASVVILKYQLLPKLYVEATSGLNNALDIFYEVSTGKVE